MLTTVRVPLPSPEMLGSVAAVLRDWTISRASPMTTKLALSPMPASASPEGVGDTTHRPLRRIIVGLGMLPRSYPKSDQDDDLVLVVKSLIAAVDFLQGCLGEYTFATERGLVVYLLEFFNAQFVESLGGLALRHPHERPRCHLPARSLPGQLAQVLHSPRGLDGGGGQVSMAGTDEVRQSPLRGLDDELGGVGLRVLLGQLGRLDLNLVGSLLELVLDFLLRVTQLALVTRLKGVVPFLHA